ncbi:hypothetical protein TNCV_2728631 [Trichonephila clavipes]|nr:hypothetical protein TNCV_2728631 [Trichonephila clavipes]
MPNRQDFSFGEKIRRAASPISKSPIITINDVTNDFRAMIDNENFAPEITPYLKRFGRISSEIWESTEEKQDQRKAFFDKSHRPGPLYCPGDKVDNPSPFQQCCPEEDS